MSRLLVALSQVCLRDGVLYYSRAGVLGKMLPNLYSLALAASCAAGQVWRSGKTGTEIG